MGDIAGSWPVRLSCWLAAGGCVLGRGAGGGTGVIATNILDNY